MFNYQGKFAIFHNSIIFVIFILTGVLVIEDLIHSPKHIECTVDPFLYQKLLISHFEHLQIQKDTIALKKKKLKKGHV